jgi:hypothetical protein
MNLSELLKQLPDAGTIKFSENPQVDQAMREGEAAFSRRQYDEARRSYMRALALEPANYSAALFIGNAYDRENEFGKSAEWYKRAIELAPNVETGYRYYADLLAKQGDMSQARTMLLHAAMAEPYNRIVWRELHAWAILNKTQIRQVFIGIPKEQNNEASVIWQPYRDVKSRWATSGEFQKHFPEERQYRLSLLEEVEALTAVADGFLGSDRARDTHADPSLTLLLQLRQADLISPYVLFSLGGPGIAHDYDSFRAQNRDKLEEYLDKFVVPHLSDRMPR